MKPWGRSACCRAAPVPPPHTSASATSASWSCTAQRSAARERLSPGAHTKPEPLRGSVSRRAGALDPRPHVRSRVVPHKEAGSSSRSARSTRAVHRRHSARPQHAHLHGHCRGAALLAGPGPAHHPHLSLSQAEGARWVQPGHRALGARTDLHSAQPPHSVAVLAVGTLAP